ncbi:transporter substrate-binding domain-containing protein [Candidatus Dependentiae bacterium]|nr:transporter substrate-binding domain-containing protein [Candidatus Dependentiae bacterium]
MKLFNSAFLAVTLLGFATAFAGLGPDCGTSLATLNVATQLGIPPYESLTVSTTPQLVGFDVAIACELRRRLGYANIVIKNTDANLAATLNTGVASIAISGLNEINARTNVNAGGFAAVVKYADFSFGLLYPNAIPQGVDGLNALGRLNAGQGSTVGVLENSWELRILGVQQFSGIASREFPNVEAALAALRAGTIDAFFSSSVIVNNANATNPTLIPLNDVVLPTGAALDPFRSTALGIQIHPTCCQLYVNVRQAIADMVADGTYAALARINNVPTTFVPVDLTPATCANAIPAIRPNLPVRNAIVTFIFNKYCLCRPSIVNLP